MPSPFELDMTAFIGSSLLVQPDGKIVQVGTLFSHGQGTIALVRYNSDGSRDMDFIGGGTSSGVSGVDHRGLSAVLQSDGKIVVGGFEVDEINVGHSTSNYYHLERFNADGTPDVSFNTHAALGINLSESQHNHSAYGVAALEDYSTGDLIRTIVLAGEIPTAQFAVQRYDDLGNLDTSLGTNGMLPSGNLSTGFGIVVDGGGKVLAGGVRYNTDGIVDNDFAGYGGGLTGKATTLDGDGNIIVVGYAGNDMAVGRYNADGTLDGTSGLHTYGLGSGSYGVATDVVVDGSGNILASGDCYFYLRHNEAGALIGYNANVVIRILPTGELDTSFGDQGKVIINTGAVNHGGLQTGKVSIALQGDKILVSGTNEGGNNSTFFTIRLNADGNVDGTFILGSNAGDTLTGIVGAPDGGSDDIINAMAGNDSISGGDGDDIIIGGSGDDIINGGTGSDTADYSDASTAVVVNLSNGTATGDGSDTLTGIENANGGSGADTLTAVSTGSILDGGAGNDNLFGGVGNDELIGGIGNDELAGGAGNDTLDGGAGFNCADYSAATTNLTINLQAGTAVGGTDVGSDSLSNMQEACSGSGNDVITALLSTASQLEGAAGNDTLNGGNAADTLDGGSGADSLIGGAGEDVLSGGAGNDNLFGGIGNDELAGGAGNDTLDGGAGFNCADYSAATTNLTINLQAGTAVGGTDVGSDSLSNMQEACSGSGNDVITALLSTASQLEGAAGNDTLNGGNAADTLDGGSGADSLIGGAGDDVLSGGAGNDNLFGGIGNDELAGGAGNDTLNGGVGNDTLTGDAGTDNLVGGSGDDIYIVDSTTDTITEAAGSGTDEVRSSVTYTALAVNVENLTLTGSGNINGTGNTGNNTVTGNDGNNSLSGGTGNDTLIGGLGNDTLTGDAGTDSLVGGSGDDVYVVDATDTIVEASGAGTGTDTVQSSVTFSLAAISNVENLTLTGSSAINGTGNTLDNVLTGNSGTNTLNGGDGTDTLIGGTGNDIYVVDSTSDIITELTGSGTDTVQSSVTYSLADTDGAGSNGGNVENLTLTGSSAIDGTGNSLNNIITGNSGDNSLSGGAGNDTLNGGVGNDTLTGDAGTDNLVGGSGDDIYIVDSTTDTITEAAGSGTDEVRSSVTYTALAVNVENLTLTGSGNINGTGNTGNNTVTGNDGNNSLSGGTGNDTLIGGLGNDTLTGDAGTDSLVGGSGDDVYVVDATDTIVEASGAGTGTDTVQSSVTFSLAAISNVENLTLTGSSAINGTGNTLDNVLTGNSGTNTLNGGDGTDTLIGGTGNDIYVVDSTSDIITELTGSGTDTVQSSVTYSLADTDGAGSNGGNVENLTLTGSSAIDGTGNSLNNIITGNSGDNSLSGGAGNDTLNGGVGNDTLTGDAGTDNLVGGSGDDIYIVDSTTDTITEAAGSGTDEVRSSVTYTALAVNVENLTLTGSGNINGTGNTGNNTVTGNDGNNSLSGGTGNDTLIGGLGNDTLTGDAGTDSLVGGSGDDVYVVDATDTIVEASGAGTGTDTVQSSVTFSLAAISNVENLTLTGSSAINGTGNTLDNVLTGNSGTNTLNGGDGTDTLIGGTGNDIYVVDSTSDIITELTGSGTDTVQSSVTYSLADTDGAGSNGGNVENLTLTGSSAIDGTGNSLNNIITGNSGDNSLSGGAGNDTLNGGVGNDTLTGDAGTDNLVGGSGDDIYIVDSTTDTITEAAGSGTDEVRSSVTYTALAVNVENLTLTGSGNINGTGNTGNNTVTGNDGNNSLSGGTGNDTLIGGLGNDTLTGDAGTDSLVGGSGDDVYVVDATDTIVEASGAGTGTDTVQSSVTFSLAAISNVENLTLTGSSAINGTGNTLDNVLTGNSGTNTLNGGDGTDTLIGGTGNDIYVVDSTSDIITELTGSGTDTVQSSVTYSLADTDGAGSNGGNVENLTLTGSSAIDGTGNSLNNIITGNSGDNSLSGGAGNDTLNGGVGNDTLTGDAGTDNLVGGSGDDIYIVDSTTDTITEAAGSGTDEVRSSVTYTALAVNVENLTLTGSGNINGTGNTGNNTVTGNDGNNSLSGGTGNDTLIGGLGNDTLTGDAGTDSLVGGSGDDVYVVDATDTIVEASGAGTGTDTVQSSVTFSLAAISNVENLTLTGSSAINGTGNTLDNVLTGNSGTNTLNGGDGTDTLIGGTGNDIYVVDSTSDIITELTGSGTDTVQSSVTYSLADTDGAGSNGGNVENLTLTGSSAIDGTGNSLNNIITGNSGDNSLSGGAGNDTLIGGVGNDTYYVNSSGDVVTEYLNQGIDTIIFSTISLYSISFSNFENLTYSGVSNATLTGNDAANTLTGSSGNDALNGGKGGDAMIGGAGNDSLIGGDGADTYMFSGVTLSSNGSDTITFVTADDTLQFSLADVNVATGAGLSSGVISAGNIVIGVGAVALDADDYFLYNSSTGALSFDADGSDGGSSVLLATLVGHPAITTADLVLF